MFFFYIKFCFCVFYQCENKKREKCIANYLLIREFQMFFFYIQFFFCVFYQCENKKREECITNYLLIREFQMFFLYQILLLRVLSM